LRKDLENVRYSNDALLDRNHDLKLELESLNQHSELLTSQNRELQRELDSFVETDDVVRRNLDRKDKVVQIRQ
jgi:cell division protein FtsB